jgi:putative ABC transport system permease protein
MPDSIGAELATIQGIERVEAIRFLKAEIAGQSAVILARDFSLYQDPPLDLVGGDPRSLLDRLRKGEAVIGSVLAEKTGAKTGDTLEVTVGTQTHRFPIAGIATEYTFGGAVAFIDRSTAKRLIGIEGADSYLIKAQAGHAGAVGAALTSLAEREGLLLHSFGELMALIDSMVAGVTGGLWVLLTLSLLVGALGVTNTLMMSVLEQSRELGMLRAIGMRRGQIIKTIVGQGALLGLVGIVGGAAAGLSLAHGINISLGSLFGRIVEFAVRPQFLLALVAASLALVLLAAAFPAWRASTLSPIQDSRED